MHKPEPKWKTRHLEALQVARPDNLPLYRFFNRQSILKNDSSSARGSNDKAPVELLLAFSAFSGVELGLYGIGDEDVKLLGPPERPSICPVL